MFPMLFNKLCFGVGSVHKFTRQRLLVFLKKEA